MRNLSDLFGGKVSAEVDLERRSLDDEILGEYMDQEWRQAFLANEVRLLTISLIMTEIFWCRYNLVVPRENVSAGHNEQRRTLRVTQSAQDIRPQYYCVLLNTSRYSNGPAK